jgi:hypothetical protein
MLGQARISNLDSLLLNILLLSGDLQWRLCKPLGQECGFHFWSFGHFFETIPSESENALDQKDL